MWNLSFSLIKCFNETIAAYFPCNYCSKKTLPFSYFNFSLLLGYRLTFCFVSKCNLKLFLKSIIVNKLNIEEQLTYWLLLLIAQGKISFLNIHIHIYVPSHEKTCINDIKSVFLFLHTSCISNCAEQILKNSCSYLV